MIHAARARQPAATTAAAIAASSSAQGATVCATNATHPHAAPTKPPNGACCGDAAITTEARAKIPTLSMLDNHIDSRTPGATRCMRLLLSTAGVAVAASSAPKTSATATLTASNRRESTPGAG